MPINYINSGYGELVKHVRASNVRRKRAKVGVTYRAMMEEEKVHTDDISKIFLQGNIIKSDKRRSSTKPASQRNVFRTSNNRKKKKFYSHTKKSREQKDSFFGRTSPFSSPPNINKNIKIHNVRKKDNCNNKDFPSSQQDVNKFLNKVNNLSETLTNNENITSNYSHWDNKLIVRLLSKDSYNLKFAIDKILSYFFEGSKIPKVWNV